MSVKIIEGPLQKLESPTKLFVVEEKSSSEKKKSKSRFYYKRDSIEKRINHKGTPGTPRYQRYLNRKYLAELQEEINFEKAVSGDEDDEDEWRECLDFEEENDIIDFEDSYFGVLNEEEAQKLWAPFLRCTIEEQEQMLHDLSTSNPCSQMDIPTKHRIPKRYFDPLQKCTKNAFYFAFICQLEVNLQHYLHVIGAIDRSCNNCWSSVDSVSFVESGKVDPLGLSITLDGNDRFPVLNAILESTYHRLLCHGLCSYYNLVSESFTDNDGQRITQIRIGKCVSSVKSDWVPSFPEKSLSSYLLCKSV